MTTFPNSPKVLKGGIVLIDAESARVLRIVSLQYNPESLSRTLQIQTAGGDGEQRLGAHASPRSPRPRDASSPCA